MGCIVKLGPGESKHAHIGISLPGSLKNTRAQCMLMEHCSLSPEGDRIVEEFPDNLDEFKKCRKRYGVVYWSRLSSSAASADLCTSRRLTRRVTPNSAHQHPNHPHQTTTGVSAATTACLSPSLTHCPLPPPSTATALHRGGPLPVVSPVSRKIRPCHAVVCGE